VVDDSFLVQLFLKPPFSLPGGTGVALVCSIVHLSISIPLIRFFYIPRLVGTIRRAEVYSLPFGKGKRGRGKEMR